jgi:hypothetical protein
MTALLKRVLLAMTSGYILVYYGELVFWATPERDGMTAGGILAQWLIYTVFAYAFLCVVSIFRVRSVWAVLLAGAFYGWFEEGIVVQTMYGTPDNPFPVSIAFTGLAWHMLVGVFVGWYLVRRVLAQNRVFKTIGLACVIGLFYGAWAIWWWAEPPAPMKALLDAGHKEVLLVRFGIFALSTTAVLIVAHWLYNRVLPFVFKPGKIELWFFAVATILYFAFVTVPAAPKALWVLPPLMAITLGALNKNRRVESERDAISAFNANVKPLNYLLLFLIPLVAISIYSLALATGASLRTNLVVYYGGSALGVLLWMVSIAMVYRRTGPANLRGARATGRGEP